LGALSGRGSDGARIRTDIGLGERKRCDDFTTRQPWQVSLFLPLSAIENQSLGPDSVICADQGAKGGRCLSELESNLNFFLHGQPQATIGFWYGEPKEAHVPHLVNDIFWYCVVFRGEVLAGHQALAHEATHGIQQCLKHFRVADHAGNSKSLRRRRIKQQLFRG
jgi:hypothetical protein